MLLQKCPVELCSAPELKSFSKLYLDFYHFKLIAPKCNLNLTQIKGKGRMHTYFLVEQDTLSITANEMHLVTSENKPSDITSTSPGVLQYESVQNCWNCSYWSLAMPAAVPCKRIIIFVQLKLCPGLLMLLLGRFSVTEAALSGEFWFLHLISNFWPPPRPSSGFCLLGQDHPGLWSCWFTLLSRLGVLKQPSPADSKFNSNSTNAQCNSDNHLHLSSKTFGIRFCPDLDSIF